MVKRTGSIGCCYFQPRVYSINEVGQEDAIFSFISACERSKDIATHQRQQPYPSQQKKAAVTITILIASNQGLENLHSMDNQNYFFQQILSATTGSTMMQYCQYVSEVSNVESERARGCGGLTGHCFFQNSGTALAA